MHTNSSITKTNNYKVSDRVEVLLPITIRWILSNNSNLIRQRSSNILSSEQLLSLGETKLEWVLMLRKGAIYLITLVSLPSFLALYLPNRRITLHFCTVSFCIILTLYSLKILCPYIQEHLHKLGSLAYLQVMQGVQNYKHQDNQT